MSKSAKELYVGKLPFEATEYDLEKFFSVSGKVTSIHLITDNKTGEFKGCGYVRMSTEKEAKDAIASLDGAILLGRIITVSIANPQKLKPVGGYQGKAPRGGAAPGKPAPPAAAGSAAKASKPAAPRPAAAKPAAARTATPAAPRTAKPAADRSARPAASKPAGKAPGARPAGKVSASRPSGKAVTPRGKR